MNRSIPGKSFCGNQIIDIVCYFPLLMARPVADQLWLRPLGSVLGSCHGIDTSWNRSPVVLDVQVAVFFIYLIFQSKIFPSMIQGTDTPPTVVVWQGDNNLSFFSRYILFKSRQHRSNQILWHKRTAAICHYLKCLFLILVECYTWYFWTLHMNGLTLSTCFRIFCEVMSGSDLHFLIDHMG